MRSELDDLLLVCCIALHLFSLYSGFRLQNGVSRFKEQGLASTSEGAFATHPSVQPARGTGKMYPLPEHSVVAEVCLRLRNGARLSAHGV